MKKQFNVRRVINPIEHTISRYRVVDPAYSRGTHVLYEIKLGYETDAIINYRVGNW